MSLGYGTADGGSVRVKSRSSGRPRRSPLALLYSGMSCWTKTRLFRRFEPAMEIRDHEMEAEESIFNVPWEELVRDQGKTPFVGSEFGPCLGEIW
jgi:hypothetical protein